MQAPEAKRQTSPFWPFSLQIYRSVADTCLELQDRFGVDVNVLLFVLFAAQNGRKLAAPDVQHIISRVASWNREAIVPLRSVRRFLRSPPEIIAGEEAEALRERVKQIELEAERLQQEGLYRSMPLQEMGTPETSAEAAGRANIAAYAAELGTAFDASLIEALLTGLREVGRSAESGRSGGP